MTTEAPPDKNVRNDEETREERSKRLFKQKIDFYGQFEFSVIDDVESYPVSIPGRDNSIGIFGNRVKFGTSDGEQKYLSATIPIECQIILVAKLLESSYQSIRTANSSKIRVDTMIYSRDTLHRACKAILKHAEELDGLLDMVVVDDRGQPESETAGSEGNTAASATE